MKQPPHKCLAAWLLAAVMLLSLCVTTTMAADSPAAAYPVYLHGGTMARNGVAVRSGDRVASDSVLSVTLDEKQFSGHEFSHWVASDGTLIPEKAFRVLVNRMIAFYPVFTDLTGNFGDWKVLEKGDFCTDGTLFAREDSASGLKEYRLERGDHKAFTFSELDGERHTRHCVDCPYTDTYTHNWNAGAVTTEPTHTAEGVKTYTCTQCGATKTEPVEKTSEHSYGEWKIVKEAKNGETGYRRKACPCGETVESYYVKAEWLPFYKEHNVKMRKMDSRSGYDQYERHYNFTDAEGREVSVFMWRRINVNDEPCYVVMFVDDHSGGLQPIYLRRNYAKYGDNYYNAHDWAVLDYAKDTDEYLEKISHMSLFGEKGLGSYASLTDDAFTRWESFYNQYPRSKENWYEDYGYTRTETTRLGYDCWKYLKTAEDNSYSIYYIVTKNSNVCLEYYAGNERYGNYIDYSKEMYYEDARPEGLTEGSGEGSLYEWKQTHCWVKEIGTTAEYEYSHAINTEFTPAPPEHPAGYRLSVDHKKIYASWNQTYEALGSGFFDYRHNFDIRPVYSDIQKYGGYNGDYHAAILHALDGESHPEYRFVRWEKYNWQTGEWEFFSDARDQKVNYVEAKKDAAGNAVKDSNGNYIYTVDNRFTEATGIRAIYEDVTYHIKVNGGYYQLYESWNKWSDEKYPEGDVKYGTKIKIDYDRSLIPEGKEVDRIIDDATGEKAESYEIDVKADGAYTVTYQPETAYFSPEVENGVVKMDGEAFTGGRFPIGTSVTLTTEGNEGYPYFKGWCRIRYGSSKTYTVLSTNTTYTAKITEDYDSRQITAVWSDTDAPLPEPQEPSWHNVTIVNGLARAYYDGIAVSALRVPDESTVIAVRDPSLKREVSCWVLTDADGSGTALEQQSYADDGNRFYISGASEGDGKYGGKGGKPTSGGSPANILITGVLKQYCIHACGICGGCTNRTSECGATKCTCETAQPLQTTQPVNLPILINGVSGAINAVALEVDGIAANQTNPFVSYALQAAEGYEVDKIYDISLQDASGQKYTLNDNETATITLTIGTANAQLIDEGKLVLIHITDTGRVIYGKEEMSGQKKFDAVDTANGTVTFTTDSCSPFVLARKAGVSVKGKVVSCNPNNATTIQLMQGGKEQYKTTIAADTGSGQEEQSFTFPTVAKGTYDLVVTKDGHLTYTVKGVVVGDAALDLTAHSNAAISTITLLCGDIVKNGYIDFADYQELLSPANYGKKTTDTGVNALTDLNGNGYIDFADYQILLSSQHYGKSTVTVDFAE